MAPSKTLQIRLTPVQWRLTRRLCAKLGLDHSNVFRLALARLAEQEKVLNPPPSEDRMR
jgi:antitoxin component of RelBE/YafQ-DinJ toxin-antitoxin module